MVRNNGQFVLQGEGGVPAFDGKGNPVQFGDYVSGLLANSKMLKTAESNNGANGQRQSFSGEGKGNFNTTKIVAAVDQSLADLG